MNKKISIWIFFSAFLLYACSAVSGVETSITTDTTQILPTATQTPAVTGMPTDTKLATPQPTLNSGMDQTPALWEKFPPGDYIAFAGHEGAGWESIPSIHVISVGGQDFGMLGSGITRAARLSPDGKEVAYIEFATNSSKLTILNLTTDKAKSFAISDCQMPLDTVAWSPDGSHVAISCISHIAIVDITGEKANLVTSLSSVDPNQVITGLAWSLNGKYLSFYTYKLNDARGSSSRGPYITDPVCPDDILSCKLIATSLDVPTSLDGEGLPMARWTPTNLLAIVQDARIMIFDPITRELVNTVIIPENRPIQSFAWSPDNQWIVYTVLREESTSYVTELYRIPVNKSQSMLLAENTGDVMFWLHIPNN